MNCYLSSTFFHLKFKTQNSTLPSINILLEIVNFEYASRLIAVLILSEERKVRATQSAVLPNRKGPMQIGYSKCHRK
jgi:hypothetical protein